MDTTQNTENADDQMKVFALNVVSAERHWETLIDDNKDINLNAQKSINTLLSFVYETPTKKMSQQAFWVTCL
jgi:hypothetical protein